MKIFFCSFLFFLLTLPAYCNDIQVNRVDTVPHQFRDFDGKTISKNSTGREFVYEVNPDKEGGFWAILNYYLGRLLEKTGRVQWHEVSLNDLILYGLIIFAAVLIILQLFKVQIQGLFQRDAGTIIHHKSETENVFETDFDSLIKQAVEVRNYRLAIRLLYLLSLRRLSESGLIRWQRNKTNFEYYYELKDETLRRQFYKLTLVFEGAWYGQIDIPEDIYEREVESFTGFFRLIGK